MTGVQDMGLVPSGNLSSVDLVPLKKYELGLLGLREEGLGAPTPGSEGGGWGA